MDKIKLVWGSVSGYKTYAISIMMVLVGLYKGDTSLVLEGLALMGVRHGISTEITQFITRKKK